MNDNTTIRVNEKRLWDSVVEMARHGALPNGGSCRLALSPEDGAGRDLFVKWCTDAGCEVSYDQVGNIYARRSGNIPESPAVATGSHLDTQPHGGKFDGIFGVLAGLEVIRTLNDNAIRTLKPVDVVVWTNEEAVRFAPPLTGSQSFAGKLNPEAIHQTVTVDGSTVLSDLRSIGYFGTDRPGDRKLDSFIEAHIEQGPILENENKTIGVVNRVQGAFAAAVSLKGSDGHAGTVPLNMRRDACLGASEMVVFLNKLASETDEAAKLTVGIFKVNPHSMSTIPGEAYFTIDCRHPDAATLASLRAEAESGVHKIADARGLECDFNVLFEVSPVEFNPDIVGKIENSTRNLGYPYKRMLSGAGHDAMNIAKIVPLR